MNLKEIGIIPLNLALLKKDIGLVNISLYSNIFNNVMNRIITNNVTDLDQRVRHALQDINNNFEAINLSQSLYYQRKFDENGNPINEQDVDNV